MSVDILLPMGRIVAGNPIKMNPATDDKGAPVFLKGTQTQKLESYSGFAIPKGNETHWNQTAWGQIIWAQGSTAYPMMTQRPDFSWKIIDGDSPIPNKKGKAPNSREGWPGHWVINLATQYGVKCYHEGKYSPHEQIIDENAIKTGDYGQFYINVNPNGTDAQPSQTPGVYLNPIHFSLNRPGELIQTSSGPSAAEAFGAVAPTAMPAAPAATQPAPTAMPAAPIQVQPAHDFVNPPAMPVAEKMYTVEGAQYTAAQLHGFGWTDAHIAALGQ